ncbi:DUF2975 domain-containing protein [Microbacterium sp. 179-B 1A2 NHS]|uniref:DUF2975 domain-containing protein n=1 Tax=Microbacterium sp. 179-B 1A2 NHS TaxID=3142383 RepID=UPI0039A2C987
MAHASIVILRVVLAVSLAGSLFVQTFIGTALWFDLIMIPLGFRIALLAIFVLWIGCLQVVAVCVWRLLTLVSDGAVFSAKAFRVVDVVIAAILVAAALTAALASLLVPGEAAPGVVGLIYGAALVTGGVALVVVVMKSLLRQATDMRAELAEVV